MMCCRDKLHIRSLNIISFHKHHKVASEAKWPTVDCLTRTEMTKNIRTQEELFKDTRQFTPLSVACLSVMNRSWISKLNNIFTSLKQHQRPASRPLFSSNLLPRSSRRTRGRTRSLTISLAVKWKRRRWLPPESEWNAKLKVNLLDDFTNNKDRCIHCQLLPPHTEISYSSIAHRWIPGGSVF